MWCSRTVLLIWLLLSLVRFGFMAYQTLLFIKCKIMFLHKNWIYDLKTLCRYTQLNNQMLNSSIWPIDRTLLSATIPVQSGPGSAGNEVVFRIPHKSSVTGAPPSLMSYPGYSLGGEWPYTSADMQLAYSTASANWAGYSFQEFSFLFYQRDHIFI